MLFKLLSLLAASKGGALAAATIVAGATTVSVMTTSPEVQDAVSTLSQIVSPGMSQQAKAGKVHDACDGGGQPVVVAQRNAADKLLRDAYQDEHKRLVDLRSGKDVDHQQANEILRTADRALRGVLTQALNDVAAQTLGREGQLKFAEPSPTATPTATATASPTATATASPTATPTCTPAPSPTATPTATATPTGSPSSDEQRGRAAVAARVTLNATLQGIVDKAKTDMKAVVDKAETDLGALPAAEHGKSAEHGKPESQPGKAEEKQNTEHGKPSDRPGGKPSTVPARP